MAWTSDDLITAVRRKARLPDDVNGANASLTDADILALADEAMMSVVVPFIRRHREEYYVTQTDIPIPTDQNEFRLPTRAQGQALRDVVLLAQAGDEVSIPYVPLEDVGTYEQSKSPWWSAGSAFSIRGNTLILVPKKREPNVTLRLKYYMRPGQLIKTTEADLLAASAAGSTTATITTSNVTWPATGEVDIIHGDSPFEHISEESVSISGSTVTFGSAIDFDIPVGAYLTPKGFSPVPQMPAELQTLLITNTVARCFDALGHYQGAQTFYDESSREMKGLSELIEPRVVGERPVVVNWNSPLRFGRRRWR